LKVSARRKTTLFPAALAVTVAMLLIGCDQGKNAFVEPPPPPVKVAQPVQQDVTDFLEFTGTTRAVEEVEVRARVSGFLESMHFAPGTRVKEGALLFVIDPREYQAELEAAEAELESAKAQLERAEIELARAQRLFEQKAGSEADVVKWRGDSNVAQAAIARATAQVDRARLSLGYTRVTAPINGRVGRNLVDIGNLVGEGEPTLLTKVTQYEPMYVYFNLNENDLLRLLNKYRQDLVTQGLDPAGYPDETVSKAVETHIPVYLALADETGFPHEGTVDYSDTGVDSGTGTLQVRGSFPNPGRAPKLLPGLFVRVRIPVDQRPDALLVDERAIGSDQSGRYLLVVNSDDVVEKRPATVGQLVAGMRVIESGIQAGEWVITSGLQRARPGSKVDPERTEMMPAEAETKTGDDTSAAEQAAKP
jgi:RND family efflux transporter MFP subunit